MEKLLRQTWRMRARVKKMSAAATLELSPHEKALRRNLEDAETDPQLVAKRQAVAIAEHFGRFVQDEGARFSAYFMTESALHQQVEELFLAELGLAPYDPMDNRRAAERELVWTDKKVELYRHSNVYE